MIKIIAFILVVALVGSGCCKKPDSEQEEQQPQQPKYGQVK